ncbi:MAG: hypothetical protein EPO08_11415 [Rhodospirillaceae bacterium]|nr:MAG: hypothetical protein EPO08_11415 [Rhodospirillaceae bacterium]
MHTDKSSIRQSAFARAWSFIESARALPIDRLLRFAILLALEEDARQATAGTHGLSIAILADRVAVSLEVARHSVRALRVDGLVILASKRLSRTEFFTLSETARSYIAVCLESLDDPLPLMEAKAL